MRRLIVASLSAFFLNGCDGLYYGLTLPHPPPFPEEDVIDDRPDDTPRDDATSQDDVREPPVDATPDAVVSDAVDASTEDAPDASAPDVLFADTPDASETEMPDAGEDAPALDVQMPPDLVVADTPDVVLGMDVVDVPPPDDRPDVVVFPDRPDVVVGMDVVDVPPPDDRPDVVVFPDRPDVVDVPALPDVRDVGPETMPDSGPPTVTLYFRYAAFAAPPIELVRVSMVPRGRELIDFPFRDADCIGGLQNGVTLFGQPGWMSCRIEVWGTAPTTPEYTLFWRLFPLPDESRCYDAAESAIGVGARLYRLRDLEMSNGGACIGGGGLMGVTYAGRFYTNGFRVRFPLAP